jgi:hypothetical protein
MKTLVVVSDIHHAGPAEAARRGFESRSIPGSFQRLLARTYRRWFWMCDPFVQPGLFDKFLASAGRPDLVVANGDFSVDSAFVGLADQAVFETVQECLLKLRPRFPDGFRPVLGDHELGKMNLFGGLGGLRLASYERAVGELGFKPFWTVEWGVYVLMAVTSSLVALPIFSPELLPEERAGWEALRQEHLAAIRQGFLDLKPGQRVLLFSHDPTALPFLAKDEVVGPYLPRIQRTIVGHLHSNLILRLSRLLAGMPQLRFLGNTVRRNSLALRRARGWKPFRVLLCPSTRGIQLLKDGGFLRLELDPDGRQPMRWALEPLAWDGSAGA